MMPMRIFETIKRYTCTWTICSESSAAIPFARHSPITMHLDASVSISLGAEQYFGLLKVYQQDLGTPVYG